MSIFFAAPIDQFPDYDKVVTVPGVVTANSAYPAANLLTYDPTQAMIGTTTTPVITWDLGAVKSFDVISLIYTNLIDTSTITLEVSTDGSVWTTLQAAGTLALAHSVVGQATQNKKNMLRRNHTLYNSATVLSYRYIRLTPNSQSAGLFPSIGRLFVGLKFVPATGWQYGSQFTFTDLGKRERTDRGALVMDPVGSLIGAQVKLEFLTKNEMYDFVFEFNYWRGATREFLACLDVEDTKRLQKNLMYCTISEGRQISHDTFNTHSSTWVLENIGI